jgi:uncharacterized protein
MPMTVEAAGGRQGKSGERVLGYDLARSIALLGMIVVHFGLVMAADHSRPAWAVAVLRLFDGRAAAIFMVLAGVGVSLRARRAVASADFRAIERVRRTLINRGRFLLVVGFVNLLIWQGDILRVYGVSLLLTARLITARDRRLLSIALAFVLGFLVLLPFVDYDKNWEWSTMTYHRLWTLEGTFRNLFYDGFRSVLPWTGILVFGLWLGRQDLRDRARNLRFFRVAVSVVLVAEGISWLCVSYFRAHPHGMDDNTIKALFGTESMPPLPLFLLSSVGTAVAVIALCVRVAEMWPSSRWLRPLTAMGQMALTWYFLHIAIGLGTVDALGLTAKQPLPVGEVCGVLFFTLAVLTSWVWKAYFAHGPLEWIMRKVADEPVVTIEGPSGKESP